MSKVDKNDLIYFKEGCDKTYATSRNADSDGLVQQTVDSKSVYPRTKSKAVIMSDGKTLDESMKVSLTDAIISGSTYINKTGTYHYDILLYPNNYNIAVKTVEVTTSCSEITASSVTKDGFTLNVNSMPSSASQTLTVKVTDVNSKVITGTFSFTVGQEATEIVVSGSDVVENKTNNRYTISYSPSTAKIMPVKVEVTTNQPSVQVGSVSTTMFVLSPNCDSNLTIGITIKAIFASGNVITKTHYVAVNCGPDYDTIDEYGVAIMDVNGKFYQTASSWQAAGNPTANGIAVSDGMHRFCIAKDIVNHVCSSSTYANDIEYWGGNGKTINGVISSTDISVACQDFNGVANTNYISSQVNSSDGYFTKSPWSAAGLCKQFTFPNGSPGYLGAAGEWNLVLNHKNTIQTLLSAIGGTQFDTGDNPSYWASTVAQNDNAWCCSFRFNGSINYDYRYSTRHVRAFCEF